MEYTFLSTISVLEFYKHLSTSLGLDIKGDKTMMFKNIQKHIHYLFKEKKP